MDARWNNDVLNPAFAALTADDFEVIQSAGGRARRSRHPRIRGLFGKARGASSACLLIRSGTSVSAGRGRHRRRSTPLRGTARRRARSARRAYIGRGRPRPCISASACASVISPRPTAASTPTMRRTIFQRKWEPCDADEDQRAALGQLEPLQQHARGFLVRVVVRERLEVLHPDEAAGCLRMPRHVRAARGPTRRTASRTPSAAARSDRGSCATGRRGGRGSDAALCRPSGCGCPRAARR